MNFGKRKMLVAFLERDNVKLLAYDVSGRSAVRAFGGQITFAAEILREAFIADPVKFTAQVRAALTQKENITPISEGLLLMPPDKTFVKAMNKDEPLESFIRTLPYFKEELIVVGQSGPEAAGKVNYVALEKKLVEDLERPFLDGGKKIVGVEASLTMLAQHFIQPGRYFLLIPFEKEATLVAMESGVILDFVTYPKDTVAGRINEFKVGKNFTDINRLYVLGIFDPAVLEKIHSEQNLTVGELAKSDVYDLAVNAFLNKPGVAKASLPSLPALPSKFLFLGGAALIGFILVFLIGKGLLGAKQGATPAKPSKAEVNKEVAAAPAPAPEPKPSDFKVRVLNGTLVAGEAAKAGEALSAAGFKVTETKNATSSGFVATRLRTNADVPAAIVEKIKSTLLESYQAVTQEPFSDPAVQVEVIIGKKK